MMTSRTARLGIELIEPGQSQKEWFHNEALATIDLALHAGVVEAGRNDPPTTAEVGQSWIVGAAPTATWAGQAHAIAGWTVAGWRFVAAREGLAVWDEMRKIPLRFSQGAWEEGVVRAAELRVGGERVVGARRPAIADPAGGGSVDAEARAAIAAVLDALREHGLVAP